MSSKFTWSVCTNRFQDPQDPSQIRWHARWDQSKFFLLLWISLVCTLKNVCFQTSFGHLSQVFDFLPSAQPFLNIEVNAQLLIHSVFNCRPSAIEGSAQSAPVCPKCPCEIGNLNFLKASLLRKYPQVSPLHNICLPLWISLVWNFKTVSSQSPLGHLSQVFDFLPSSQGTAISNYWSECTVAYPFCFQLQAQCSRWICPKCPCEIGNKNFLKASLLRKHPRWAHHTISVFPCELPSCATSKLFPPNLL